jgi:RNA polymerase sigma-70 factor (ECF subfamily)
VLRDVYRDNVASVYAFFSYSVDSGTAEELTASTFERVVRSWRSFDASRAGVRVWVLAIARNILTDHYRRRSHRAGPSIDEFPALAMSLATEDRGGWLELDAILSWLTELPPREREVLALRYGADLSTHEIAGCLGLSEANVNQIASRALRRLRKSDKAAAFNGNGAADAARLRAGR